MPRLAVALFMAAVTAVTATASTGSGRAPFTLVFEGARSTSADTATFAFGFRDEGAFNALPPLCEAGQAVDVERGLTNGWITGVRRFDCDGGAGSIIARTWLLGGDPSSGYEEGAWLIVAGTGAYDRLRGKGTYVRVSPEDASASTAELWRGLVDFDDVPPQVTILGISIAKPRQPGGAYAVRLVFRARDASGGPVSFLVTARSRVLLAAKYGVALPDTSGVVLNVLPRAGERRVRLDIEASDQVGNVRTIVRTRALPRAS